MPALTRRRYRNLPQECWRVYYGDVHVGAISQCVGNPGAAPKWQWRCGFYPGNRPANAQPGWRRRSRRPAAFERTWTVFLAKRTEADFQAWRDQRDWTARKYALWDAGQRLPLPGVH